MAAEGSGDGRAEGAGGTAGAAGLSSRWLRRRQSAAPVDDAAAQRSPGEAPDIETPETTPARPGLTQRLGAMGAALTILCVIAAGFTAWALRSMLVPFAMAVFLLLVIGGLEGVMTRRLRLPRRAALPLAIVAVVALFGFSIWLITQNAAGMVEQSGVYAARLDQLLQQGADRFGLEAAPTINELFHRLDPGRLAPVVAREAGHLFEGAVLVGIYLGFLLASREGFRGKLERMFQDRSHDEALQVVRRIQHGVESYVWVQTVGGLIIGGASVVVMWPLGISHLTFWAFLIFMTNYIPAIGAAIGVILPALFGLVDLNDLWRPITVLALLELVHFTVGHVVLPRMQGRSLNIDPIVVLLSLAFWGAIFGIAGAFLSTPLTVVAMVVCNEFPSTRWVAILLSADGKPFAEPEAQPKSPRVRVAAG